MGIPTTDDDQKPNPVLPDVNVLPRTLLDSDRKSLSRCSPIIAPPIVFLLVPRQRRVRLWNIGVLFHSTGANTAIGLAPTALVRHTETVPEILLFGLDFPLLCCVGGLLVLAFDEFVELFGGAFRTALDALAGGKGCIACLCGEVSRCDLWSFS